MVLTRYFQRYGETSDKVIVLVGTSLILNFGFGVLIPFMPLYAEDLGASIPLVGWIIAAFTIGRAFMAYIGPRYSDLLGRRRVMIWGTALYSISTFAMAFAPNWQTLFFLRLLEGGAVGIVWPTAMAYLIDVVPKDRVGEASGLFTTSFSLGFFIGPLLGSAAFYTTETFLGGSELQALRSTFYVTGSLALIGLILIYLKIEDFDPEYYTKKEKEVSNKPLIQAERVENPRGEYRKYYAMALLNGVGIGFIIPIFTIFFVNVHGFDQAWVGVILGVSGGVTAAMSGPSGALGDKIGRKPLMLLGLPIMVFFTATLGFASTLLGAASFFWARALGLGLFFPNFRALQADVTLAFERGTVFGRVQTFFNSGAVIGPVLGGYLYEYMEGRTYQFLGHQFLGEAMPFVFTALFQSFMFIVLLMLKFPPKREVEQKFFPNLDPIIRAE